MTYNIMGVKELAFSNRWKLKQKFFNVPVNNKLYKFKISGIGSSSIKIEKFFDYSTLFDVKNAEKGELEYSISQMITNFEGKDPSDLTSVSNLKNIALTNKKELKMKYVNVYIGENEYGFRISGIGTKSIKTELYLGYDDIIRELSASNELCLEFILMQLLMDNEIDYSDFLTNSNKSNRSKNIVKSNERSFRDDLGYLKQNYQKQNEVDVSNIKKLTDDELERIMVNVKGWQKLVFDSIEDIGDDVFTIDSLLTQRRILSYQVRGESLEPKIVEILGQLEELGLISFVKNRTYAKLW